MDNRCEVLCSLGAAIFCVWGKARRGGNRMFKQRQEVSKRRLRAEALKRAMRKVEEEMARKEEQDRQLRLLGLDRDKTA